MSKALIIGDPHTGTKKIYSKFIDMQRDEWDYIHELCEGNEIDYVIVVGDMSNDRNKMDVSIMYELKRHLIKKNTKLKYIFIAGNHDCFYKNTNEICSVELLFEDFDNVRIIKNKPFEKNGCLFIPWMNKENNDECLEIIKQSSSKYCFGHFDINGFMMTRGVECTNGLNRSIFKKFERVYSGHYHLKSDEGNISYVGSLMQLNWNDFGDKKRMILLDFETGEERKIDTKSGNIFQKVYINDEDKLLEPESYSNCFLKIYINRKMKKKDETWLAKVLDTCIKAEVIDNTIIQENVDLDLHNEEFSDILKGFMKLQEELETKDKKSVSNILLKIHNEAIGQ